MKQNWQIKKLGEVCEIATGKWDANHSTENGLYRFYTCAAQYLMCDTKRFSGECLILPGNGVNVGEVYYYNGEFDAYQRTYVIHNITHRLSPRFLYYNMLLNWKKIGTSKQYGSATNFIKIGNFSDYIVPLPPLADQHRIVDILDAKFAQIDALKAAAQKNLDNAEQLWKAQLEKQFDNQKWEKKKLGEVCEIKTGGTPSRNKKEYWDNGTIPWIKTTELQNCEINEADECITAQGLDNSAAKIVPKGSVLLAMYGQGKTRGMTAYLNIDAATNQACACILPSKKYNITQKFIWKYLIGKYDAIRDLASGCNQPNLNSNMVKNFEIPLPPLAEQERIVKELDALSAKINTLKANYRRQIECCDELRQSLLRAAFEGEM